MISVFTILSKHSLPYTQPLATYPPPPACSYHMSRTASAAWLGFRQESWPGGEGWVRDWRSNLGGGDGACDGVAGDVGDDLGPGHEESCPLDRNNHGLKLLRYVHDGAISSLVFGPHLHLRVLTLLFLSGMTLLNFPILYLAFFRPGWWTKIMSPTSLPSGEGD